MVGAASELGVVGSLISLDKLEWAPGGFMGDYCDTTSLEITLVMDDQPSATVWVVRRLVGKVYNLCRVLKLSG